MINVCVYVFLVWYFYANFILSHINLANDVNLFLNSEDTPSITNKTYTALYIISPFYIASYITLCLLTIAEVIEKEDLSVINCYISFTTPVLFFGYYLFLLIKFSGRPYISEKLKMQVRRIFIIVIIWSLARIVNNHIINILGHWDSWSNII
jgi:hypothetical protein